MKTWMQKVRGAIGIGLTWAAGWAPIGAITGVATAAVLNLPLGMLATNYALLFAFLGFIGGGLFSSVLGLTERRRSFDQLSLPRFAMWGALGGFLLGGLATSAGLLGIGFTTFGAIVIGAATLLGASSATGMLAIARGARANPMLGEGARSSADA